MGMKLSICGKGGSGKSTLTGLLAQEAATRDFRVLVVDSDESNSGLYRTLGFDGPPMSLMDIVGGKKTSREKWGRRTFCNTTEFPSRRFPMTI